MTGRGIDQVLPFPLEPSIYESWIKNAKEYVELARFKNGSFSVPVSFDYIWGSSLNEISNRKADCRIVNLETSITRSDNYWRGKGINYRMNPENFLVFKSGSIDCLSLANNHLIDWGYEGLEETINTIRQNGILFCGAGKNIEEAVRPAFVDKRERGCVAVIAAGSLTSGIPPEWAATKSKAGIFVIDESRKESVSIVKNIISEYCRACELVVFSIHWGENWGYDISDQQIRFAHSIIDEAGVNIVFGHSSHHAKPVEIYNKKPVFYGCGDFINDYEGIAGYEEYRGDISCMYFVDADIRTGAIENVFLVPLIMKQFSLKNAQQEDIKWMKDTLTKSSARFGTKLKLENGNTISIEI